jgi:predicted site-specific integrase-resolvase
MQTDAVPREYFPPQQAGQYIGVTERTLVEWRRRGTGPHYIRFGGPTGRVRYARADLDTFMERQKHSSTSDEAA